MSDNIEILRAQVVELAVDAARLNDHALTAKIAKLQRKLDRECARRKGVRARFCASWRDFLARLQSTYGRAGSGV